EARTATIDLSDDDPKPLERMLRYMYTDDYDEDDQSIVDTNGEDKDVLDATVSLAGAQIRALALNGDIHAAPRMALRPSISTTWTDIVSDDGDIGEWRFPVKVSAVWNNVQVYALAEKYDVQPLKSLAAKRFRVGAAEEWKIVDILPILTEVYNTTPTADRGLREDMLKVCSRYADELMALPAFLEMLCNDGTLAVEILRVFHSTKETLDMEVYTLKETLEELELESRRSRKSIQSLQDQLTSAKEWAAEEKRVLKYILPHYACCRACSKSLHLRMTRDNVSGKKLVVLLSCDSCKRPFSES
ncbi:MAG: hypothetical protein Q9196_006906, partial [Gyalolechia fulgens]